MRSLEFQKASKFLLPFAILCAILLIFCYGYPLTATDRLLALELEQNGLFSRLTQTKGPMGTELFSALFLSHPLVRHALSAALISACTILLIRYCGAEKSYIYYMTLALVLAAPPAIFANTYAWAEGAASSLAPSFLVLLYLFTACDLFRFKGKKKAWKIPVQFVIGFLTVLFDESFGIAALILSLVLLMFQKKKFGLSLHLVAHSFGCVLGLLLSIVIPGSSQTLAPDFYVMMDRFNLALDSLFVFNWVTVGALTVTCLMLIQPFRRERSKNCNRTLALLLFSAATLLFFRFSHGSLKPFVVLNRFLAVGKLLAAGLFLYAVLRTVEHYVSKDYIGARIRNNMIAIGIFLFAFGLSAKSGENLLYLPFLAFVSCPVSLFVYAIRRYSHVELSSAKFLSFAGIAVSLMLCFISVSNALTVNVMQIHAEEQIKAEQTDIVLPALPYPRYGSEDMGLGTEYTVGSDTTVRFIPYTQWNWMEYYEAHHIPVIEEYNEKEAQEDSIFEEE